MMAREETNRISLGMIMATTLLLLAGTLLYFYHLGKTDIAIEAPARIAVYASQMNQQGTWLAPILRGQARVDIPPLYLWGVKLAALLSPTVDAYATRLPGAISSLLLVLLVAWWGYRHATRYSREDLAETPAEGIALLAGLMIASNIVLFVLGREGSLHSMFALIYVAAAFCWGESLEARRSFYAGQSWRLWIVWGYALAGLAMLIRGPIVLPLLWVPYWLAAHSYRLRRMDWVHGAGLLLALAIGASWPALVSLNYHDVAGEVWWRWMLFQLGSPTGKGPAFYDYLLRVLSEGFPWILLAVVMAVRVWQKKDRSPTLVFWMCSLVGNLLLLAFFSFYVGQHFLPVIVFIVLLAADGLYRWNFENGWAVAWRALLRVILVLAIVAGIIGSALISSSLGITIFSLLPLAWLGWAIYSRTQGWQYSPWETTIRLAAMIVLLLITGEAIWLSNLEPRRRFHKDRLSYFERVERRLPDRDRRIYLHDRPSSIIYDYYLGVQPIIDGKLSAIKPQENTPTYLFAARDLPQLMKNRRLWPVTVSWDADDNQPNEGMFKVLTAEQATTETQDMLQLALLGNTGTRAKDARLVAHRLARTKAARPLDDVLLLGNNIHGPTVFNHLDFYRGFERPFGQLLSRGVVFHAALGKEDQSWAFFQKHYNPFHMGGKRYYVQTLDGGLVDCFMLDAEELYQDKKFDETQLAWLEKALAASKAPWKVVGLSRALVSAAGQGRPDEALAARLLPLFDRYRVNLVAWAGGRWYERLEVPGHFPIFINAGWSGDSSDANFKRDARLKVGYDRRPGFVTAAFAPGRVTLKAINDKGESVDQALLPLPAAGAASQATQPLGAPAPAPAIVPAASGVKGMSAPAPTPQETAKPTANATATATPNAPATPSATLAGK